ncbi:hypothetical protein [Neolewinella agarilytica]|uniref:Thioesterase domain-containing protein n=1 Tax=Neolewinella agarilytica TaxID=478744 RepID=A0A1H9AN52_9BACT|nr:hypothetical protein [Neolewinella agarilytica]SEP77358.1 hypothetical protein SAMN05444359_102138 [Neolewinella agarilytica]
MFHHYGHPLIDRQEVTNYLPHREPMILVDRLLGIKGGTIVGELLIRPENPFVTDTGEMLLGGAIEHMAQSAGLGQAYKAASMSGPRDASKTGKGEFGFIVNIRSLQYERLPRLGETLRTEASTITQNGNHSTMSFFCYVGEQLLVSCTMGLMGPKDQNTK